MQANDNELVQRFLAGEEEAFLQIVGKYKNPITNFISMMIGDYDLAVDLSQDTFLRVYRNIESYKNTFQFSTWIYRIASNLAIDELRWRRRRGISRRSSNPPVESEESSDPVVVDGGRKPDEQCIDNEHRRLLADAIRSLPARYRSVFVLKEVEDLPYEKIGEVLNCSVGTVKSRLHRAKNLLRKKLLPYWKVQ
jgi:RNA polymerase sigma-70 factor (ECF subfamily)